MTHQIRESGVKEVCMPSLEHQLTAPGVLQVCMPSLEHQLTAPGVLQVCIDSGDLHLQPSSASVHKLQREMENGHPSKTPVPNGYDQAPESLLDTVVAADPGEIKGTDRKTKEFKYERKYHRRRDTTPNYKYPDGKLILAKVKNKIYVHGDQAERGHISGRLSRSCTSLDQLGLSLPNQPEPGMRGQFATGSSHNIDTHLDVLANDNRRMIHIDEELRKCRDILSKHTRVQRLEHEPSSRVHLSPRTCLPNVTFLEPDRNLPPPKSPWVLHTLRMGLTDESLLSTMNTIEHKAGMLTTRELISYLYTNHPPDSLFHPHNDIILDISDLYQYLSEAVLKYNPLWQRRDDNKWKNTCVFIRDLLIARFRKVHIESAAELAAERRRHAWARHDDRITQF